MTYYNIHCQTANVYGFPYKPLMAKRINRCQSLPSGKAHPAQTDEHRCAHQRVQGHKWNGHFQRCLSWLRRLLGSAMFSLWNGIFGPTQPTHLKKSIKFHDFGWFWMILGCSSLFKSIYRHVSGSHCKCKAATVSSNTWIWRNACKSFFLDKIVQVCNEVTMFFQGWKSKCFCVFSNYQAAPASGVISTICEFMKLPSAARCGKFWTARW